MTPLGNQETPPPRPRAPVRHLVPATLLAALVVVVFSPGLSGPFLFDDPVNILIPFRAWLAGDTTWHEVVFGNRSGPFGRPLSMLSFAVNAALSGLDAFAFKFTNIAIHILCGAVLHGLLLRLLRRDARLYKHAKLVAGAVTAIWLLHPMQVSTVLYVVQRMAQLSALFALLAVLAYVSGRQALEAGQLRRGWIALFGWVPLATLAAVMSKENGALVPLYCAVVEIGYFKLASGQRRPWVVGAFFLLYLVIPALVVALFYLPDKLVSGYEGRLFTLVERVLSQPRAILEYVTALLVPSGPSLGVYTDDFTVSRGWLSPPSTLFAALCLGALTGIAWLVRKREPAVFVGVGIFLAGHAMESTIFPLELYFEHRNYLPSAGLFLALAGSSAWLLPNLFARSTKPARLRAVLMAALLLYIGLLAVATWARSTVWSSWPALAEQGVREHPRSRRAHLDHISMLLAQGRSAEAMRTFDALERIGDDASKHAAIIGKVWLQCYLYEQVDKEGVARLRSIAGARLELGELLSVERLGNLLIERGCQGLSKTNLGYILSEIVNEAPQPETLTPLWRTRFMASRLFLEDGQLALATEQAALAWMTERADPAVGVLLSALYLQQGDVQSATLILDDVRRKLPAWDQRNRELIELLQNKILQHD